ncbi:unnamed protein product [Ambrosiozyma monospora]|uniref:Unnamed protein product n=1 Tax=Ambrosiozyma monospora TaxID=43982 RepID=A0ACB5U309_AMBMO|nr:unnamed protein product [Ambrosiozyma monospora]
MLKLEKMCVSKSMLANPKNTVFNAKRLLIGRKFDDPEVQGDLKHFPFQIVNEGGKPKIKVEFKGQTKVFTPEKTSSMALNKMKEKRC